MTDDVVDREVSPAELARYVARRDEAMSLGLRPTVAEICPNELEPGVFCWRPVPPVVQPGRFLKDTLGGVPWCTCPDQARPADDLMVRHGFWDARRDVNDLLLSARAG